MPIDIEKMKSDHSRFMHIYNRNLFNFRETFLHHFLRQIAEAMDSKNEGALIESIKSLEEACKKIGAG